jgi:glycosyltransferase involved in cell wall biosynthesis
VARFALDARMCAYRRGGIASYTEQLATALAPILAERGHTFVVGRARRGAPVLPAGRAITQPTIWTPPHHRFERWTLPLEVSRTRCDLLHSPDFLPVRPGPWRNVITIHDLDFVRHPERLTPEARRYYGRVREAIHQTDAIIAVSDATRRDAIALLGADPETITLIHEAADARFIPPVGGERCAVRGRNPASGVVPCRYFLAVGTIEPRKNQDLLLDAYAAYRRMTPDAAGLVVAGAEGWNSAGTTARLRAESGVTWLGAVSPEQLVPLYHGATALLMPSWDEGFGLPVIEAMASGTPVAISTAAALREVAGHAALIAAPDDAAAWTAIMTELSSDNGKRAALREHGIAQAARFSWHRAATETADLYERVLAAPKRRRNVRRTGGD